jgi:hypothetical protein
VPSADLPYGMCWGSVLKFHQGWACVYPTTAVVFGHVVIPNCNPYVAPGMLGLPPTILTCVICPMFASCNAWAQQTSYDHCIPSVSHFLTVSYHPAIPHSLTRSSLGQTCMYSLTVCCSRFSIPAIASKVCQDASKVCQEGSHLAHALCANAQRWSKR